MTRRPSLSEHHRFAASHVLYRPLHVAIAVVQARSDFEQHSQFEAMSQQHGVRLKAFCDLDEAQAWLALIR